MDSNELLIIGHVRGCIVLVNSMYRDECLVALNQYDGVRASINAIIPTPTSGGVPLDEDTGITSLLVRSERDLDVGWEEWQSELQVVHDAIDSVNRQLRDRPATP